MRKIIRGGTVVTAADAVRADVLIDGERIAGVGSFDGVDAEPIDATGCYVLPGLIDNHTHLSMPFGGTWSIDDYDSGTQAAAAGGTTCLVDFALQMHPNGLRSSLEEWQGRAEGTAHVDYGFHMAITSADDATIADMAAMVAEGVSTFKVFLAYKDVLMVTDDQYISVLERTRETGGPGHGARRERLGDRPAGAPCARRGHDRSDLPRAHAPRRVRGRGHVARGQARRVRRCAGLHRPRDLSRGGRRDHRRTCARRAGVRRDVPAVPAPDRGRPAPPELRGCALRLLAAAAHDRGPGGALGRAPLRPPADRLDRPLPVHGRAEAARARRLLEDPERARRHPASPDDALGARRAHGPADRRAGSSSSPRARWRSSSGCIPARARSRRAPTRTS